MTEYPEIEEAIKSCKNYFHWNEKKVEELKKKYGEDFEDFIYEQLDIVRIELKEEYFYQRCAND